MARNNMGPGFEWFDGFQVNLDFDAGRKKQRIQINKWLETIDVGSVDVALELTAPTRGGGASVKAVLGTTAILGDEDTLGMPCDKATVVATADTEFLALSAINGQGPYASSAELEQKRQPSAYTYIEFEFASGAAGHTFTATVRGWATLRGAA